jgi:hypothetical protein
MPLTKVEKVADLLKWRGYARMPRSLSRRHEFDERVELLVMSSLHILGTGATFRRCQTLTHKLTLEVRKLFMSFLDAFMDMKDECIYLPHNVAALKRTMNSYESIGLPGACGSIDVVHIKWSACPAGDHNHAKGKEGYPTVAFQCITDHNQCFLGIYGPQFGTRNDQEIFKLDPNYEDPVDLV